MRIQPLQRRPIRNIQTVKRPCKKRLLSPVTVTYKLNFFSKLRVCFFVISNRKPYAKNQLVTAGDPKRPKRAEPEVVYLGLTSQGHRKSTNLVPFERAYRSFY